MAGKNRVYIWGLSLKLDLLFICSIIYSSEVIESAEAESSTSLLLLRLCMNKAEFICLGELVND